jgi:energy-coupling factor transporter transmembrane protein EcfT
MKLSILVALSLAVLHADLIGLTMATAAAVFLMFQIRMPIRQALFELRWFLALLLLVWGLRCINTPGEPLVEWNGIALTRQGVWVGGMICWRWILIVCFSICLSASTRSADVSAAVQWTLRPLLGNSAHKVGLMIGLMMRSIAMILTQSREIADAERARAIDNRKNPFYRLKMTALPLMRRSFLSADRMAIAIAARCYGECRTPHPWRCRRRDWMALIVSLLLCGAMMLA